MMFDTFGVIDATTEGGPAQATNILVYKVYFDGFIGARKAFFDLGAVEDEDLLPPRWTRLWKIHGSLNWRLENETDVVRTDEKTDKQSYLIYPSHLKYDQSRKMPYLAMLDRLKAFLLAPSSRTAPLTSTRSPIFTSGCSAPQLPMRIMFFTPRFLSSSTAIPAEAPPMPVETASTRMPP